MLQEVVVTYLAWSGTGCERSVGGKNKRDHVTSNRFKVLRAVQIHSSVNDTSINLFYHYSYDECQFIHKAKIMNLFLHTYFLFYLHIH